MLLLNRHIMKCTSVISQFSTMRLHCTRPTLQLTSVIKKTSPLKTLVISRHLCAAPSDSTTSSAQKLKIAIKDYGYTVLVFHITISLISLGGFYVAVYSGFDVVDLFKRYNVNLSDRMTSVTGGASTLVIAYAIHKVFAPLRFAITLTCTPVVVRYFRKIGLLKAPKISK